MMASRARTRSSNCRKYHDDFARPPRITTRHMSGQISWDYDRADIITDGVMHAIGVCLGLIGTVTILVIAVNIQRIEIVLILVYVIGLVTMLALSAGFNMWPVLPVKWVLRRFDHSAIYLLIAATYTPFLAQMKDVLASAGLGSRALACLQLVSET